MSNVYDDLIGKTLVSVGGAEQYNHAITFRFSDGSVWKMHHFQNCCESVFLEDVIGDIDDLIGSPLLIAEERYEDMFGLEYGIGMWTFYEFATNKGSVTFRWYGSSNGYYSVAVSFDEINEARF